MKKFLTIIVLMVAAMSIGAYAESPVIEIVGDEAELPLAQGKPVVVDCSAVWCGPCKMFAPIFDKAAEKYQDKIMFCHVDVDECALISATYEIQYLPTIMIFDAEGNLLFRDAGALEEPAFQALLTKYLGVE